ncbi:hypothetical protein ACS3UN_08005 [Oscillospiraceae bacterium LTW-04]|nr:hypothetical protein RBH76_02340 [Oscillospiraceae bacterium MB24-C1]
MSESKKVSVAGSGAGNLCVGVSRYAFKPDDKPDVLTGFTIWLLEERENVVGEPEKYFGAIPFKVSLSDDRYAVLAAQLGIASPHDLVGNRWAPTYNRFGKVEALTYC